MSEVILLRRAVPSDLPILLEWDKAPHVIASDPNDDWDWETELPRNPPWREQFIAEHSGHPVGFLQIIDPLLEETGYWHPVENGCRAIDIWIGPAACLGQGIGTEMMRQAITRCFDLPNVTAILVDPLVSNTRAHNFYEKLGFRNDGPRKFDTDLCYVYRLERSQWFLHTTTPS